MSKFEGTNQLSTADMFFERLNYKVNAFPQGPDSLYIKPVEDFQFAERMLYGRINRNHSVIRFVNARLKDVQTQAKPSDQVRAADFVVDAFEALAREYGHLGLAGKLDVTDPFLGTLQAHKGFASSDAMYYNYRQILREFFLQEYVTPHIDQSITDFSSFLTVFFRFVRRDSAFYPITKLAFIPSGLCSPLVSGLSIEVSDLNPSDDSDKQKFMDSVNFVYLTELAKKHGFYIDKYVPWRLTADIGSLAMLQYSAAYGAPSDEAILRSYYQLAGGSDIGDLQRMALDFYNSVVQRRGNLRHYSDGKYHTICRRPASVEQLIADTSPLFWVDNYIDIRYNEQKKPGSEGQVSSLKKMIKSLATSYSLSALTSVINDAFAGFDNFEGSYARKGLARKFKQTGQNFNPTY